MEFFPLIHPPQIRSSSTTESWRGVESPITPNISFPTTAIGTIDELLSPEKDGVVATKIEGVSSISPISPSPTVTVKPTQPSRRHLALSLDHDSTAPRRLTRASFDNNNNPIILSNSTVPMKATQPSSRHMSLSLTDHESIGTRRMSRASFDGTRPLPQRGSPLLVPIVASSSSSTVVPVESPRMIPTEQNNEINLLSGEDSIQEVVVKKIFDGVKVFFREKIKAQIILFEHSKPFSQEPTSSCIEIVSYIHEFKNIDVPRIYVSPSIIFQRLKNKLLVKGSLYAQESIASYIFNRLSLSIECIDNKQTFGIILKYKNDDLANDLDDSRQFLTSIECTEEVEMGPLPHIEYIR
jgi:hypothetical protein